MNKAEINNNIIIIIEAFSTVPDKGIGVIRNVLSLTDENAEDFYQRLLAFFNEQSELAAKVVVALKFIRSKALSDYKTLKYIQSELAIFEKIIIAH